MTENKLYYGDCLTVLKDLPSDYVDLVYLDPPFNSKRDYNAFFSTELQKDADAQITAFEDTWHWGEQAQKEYNDLLQNPDAGELGETIIPALRQFLAESDMMAYLVMMASRLVELRRVLKESGSIFLHCDPTASHYLKIMLDGIFGVKNFRNEIIWGYSQGGKSKRHFGRKHDTILWYSKTNNYNFNADAVRRPLTPHKQDKHGKNFGGRMGEDENGRKYVEKWGTGKKKLYRYYLDQGKIPEDWWTDINSLQAGENERLGYPTQKPVELLERIILACSNEQDIILDPFCGCGTAIHAAEKLNRKWIGIDITHLAIGLIRQRLKKAFPNCDFKEEGTPKDIASARYLAESNSLDGRYQFQYWALFLAGALPAKGKKKGADSGVDGYIWFYDTFDPKAQPKKIVVSVKSGKIPANHIRELAGMIKSPVEVGVLLTLEEPSRKMKADAVAAGSFKYPNGHEVPKIQILTIKDLLEGKRINFMDYGEGRAMNKQAKLEIMPQNQGDLLKKHDISND